MLSQSASHAVLLGATRQESELVEMPMSNISLWRLPVKFHIGAELPDENPTLTAAKPHIGGAPISKLSGLKSSWNITRLCTAGLQPGSPSKTSRRANIIEICRDIVVEAAKHKLSSIHLKIS